MPTQDETNESRLDGFLSRLLSRRQSNNQLRALTVVPCGAVDFSSNNYLSLSSHPPIHHTFLAKLREALSTTATTPFNLLGSGGSRLLDGNSSRAEALENTIAAFHHAPAALLFNSAMDANVGLFSCVPQHDDVIIYDELIHASVHDGVRLSRARWTIPFAHNQVYSSVKEGGKRSKNGSLEAAIRSVQVGNYTTNSSIFIAVEGVYSMDGDVAPLAEIVECVEKFLTKGNGYIVVDEAHSVGILGERGRGLVSHLGLESRVWARVLGFGKAMGCSGGAVLCSPTARQYLINYARTLIYTTAMAFPSLLSIEITYELLMNGQAEPLLNHLRHLIQHTYKLLHDLSNRLPCPPGIFHIPVIAPSQPVPQHQRNMREMSPVIPIFTSLPRDLASFCQTRGFMVRPIVAPTVPIGEERVRICLHAANTFFEVEGLVQTMEEWLKGILEQSDRSDYNNEKGLQEPRSPSGSESASDGLEKPKL